MCLKLTCRGSPLQAVLRWVDLSKTGALKKESCGGTGKFLGRHQSPLAGWSSLLLYCDAIAGRFPLHV